MRSIGVLIVGHSAVVREQIGEAIRAQPGMSVAGSASDGRRGLELVEQRRPNVVVLDVQMPGFDGLQTLDALLLARAMPVVMTCDHTPTEAEMTLAALERGAQDYLAKPVPGLGPEPTFADELVRKIRGVVGLDMPRILQLRRKQYVLNRRKSGASGIVTKAAASMTTVPGGYRTACIAVGSAIGGSSAVAALLASLHPPLPPIVAALPMMPSLTAALVKRLALLTTLEVKEAVDGDELLPNRVLLAPGGKHLQVRRRSGKVTAQVIEFEPVSGNCPSADVLLHSAAEIFSDSLMAVLLSGPGRDGVAGCAAVKACGGYVLGQDEASSEIYGMNKAAFLEGYIDRQCSLDEMADVLMQLASERFAGKSSN